MDIMDTINKTANCLQFVWDYEGVFKDEYIMCVLMPILCLCFVAVARTCGVSSDVGCIEEGGVENCTCKGDLCNGAAVQVVSMATEPPVNMPLATTLLYTLCKHLYETFF